MHWGRVFGLGEAEGRGVRRPVRMYSYVCVGVHMYT